MLLQFCPAQPHYLLNFGGKMLKAGETFEASEKDAVELLECSDIRKASSISEAKPAEDDGKKAPADKPHEDIPHSPRAQRSTTT